MYLVIRTCINERNDSNDTRNGKEELGIFAIIRCSHCCKVLCESSLGLIVNVYCKF